jgi:hypothetical protein
VVAWLAQADGVQKCDQPGAASTPKIKRAVHTDGKSRNESHIKNGLRGNRVARRRSRAALD